MLWAEVILGLDERRTEELTALAGQVGEGERLHRLFAADWDYTMREYPEAATWFGYPGQDHRWTDVSLQAIDRRNRELENPARVLASIDRARLPPADQVHHDLFKRGVDEALEGRRFRAELMPLSQMEGVQQSVAQLLTMMPATSVKEYENVVARLRGVPTLVDQTIALMRAGLEAGLTPPRITLRDVPQQVRNQVVDDPMASPMLAAFKRFPEAVGGQRARPSRQGGGGGIRGRCRARRTGACSPSWRASTSRARGRRSPPPTCPTARPTTRTRSASPRRPTSPRAGSTTSASRR